MSNDILSGFRQAGKWRTLLAILAMVSLILMNYLDPLLRTIREGGRFYENYHLELLLEATRSESIASYLPILATIPFTACYVDDVKTKFVRFWMLRSGYSGYLFSRSLICFLLGGGVILIGTLLSWFLSALALAPMESLSRTSEVIVSNVIEQCVLLFINGGLWAVIGMTMSTVMESKYIAYAAPFILYYLLVILFERYFPEAFIIYPKNWINPEKWPYGVWSASILLLELTIISGIVFHIRGKRRLEQL